MSLRRRNTYVCEAKCIDIMRFINPEYDDTKRCGNDVVADLFDAVVQYVYIQDAITIKKRSYKVRVVPDKFCESMRNHIVGTKNQFNFLDFKWKLISSLRSGSEISCVEPFDFRFEMKKNLSDMRKSSVRWFARFCRRLFRKTEYDYPFEDMSVYFSYLGLMTKDFLPCKLPDCKYVALEMEDAILFVNYENEFSYIKLMLMYFSHYQLSNNKSIVLRDGLLFDFERVYDYIFVASADDEIPKLEDGGIVHETVLSGREDID